MTDWVPFEKRPRPDLQLAKVRLSLDWETITISGVNDVALGIVFAWLVGQVMAARTEQTHG